MQDKVQAEARLMDGAVIRVIRKEVGDYWTEYAEGELNACHVYPSLLKAMADFADAVVEEKLGALAHDRGVRSWAPVAMINVNIDAELKHALKLAALKARTTLKEYVTRLVEEAVSGRRPGGAPPRAGSSCGDTSRLVVRIDPELHARLKRTALAEGVTVTEYLTRLIEEAVSAAQGARGGER